MKRNLFVVSCVAIAIAGSGGAYYFCSKKIVSNHLLLENVEALTDSESNYKDCEIYLKRICTSGHVDHRGYRTVAD